MFWKKGRDEMAGVLLCDLFIFGGFRTDLILFCSFRL